MNCSHWPEVELKKYDRIYALQGPDIKSCVCVCVCVHACACVIMYAKQLQEHSYSSTILVASYS